MQLPCRLLERFESIVVLAISSEYSDMMDGWGVELAQVELVSAPYLSVWGDGVCRLLVCNAF